MGFVADRSGGLGDVVGSEGFQHADGEVAEGRHGPWCGPGVDGGGVLGEGDVPDVVRGVLHSPVPANRGGQVGRAGLVGVEAGDGVDTLTGLALAGLLTAAVDADGQAGVGKGDPAEFVRDSAGLDRAGLAPAVPGGGGGVLDGDVPPWQGRELAVGGSESK